MGVCFTHRGCDLCDAVSPGCIVGPVYHRDTGFQSFHLLCVFVPLWSNDCLKWRWSSSRSTFQEPWVMKHGAGCGSLTRSRAPILVPNSAAADVVITRLTRRTEKANGSALKSGCRRRFSRNTQIGRASCRIVC